MLNTTGCRWPRAAIVRTAVCSLLLATLCQPARAGRYPAPVGYVNDFAGVMRQETVAQLGALLTELEQKTGAEMAVVTVRTVPDGNIEQAAVDLFHAWGIGKKRRDNGVLILCAVQDRKVRIEVGYGLEPVLPDAWCGQVIREQMIPQFRAGDFSSGLKGGALTVAAAIAQHAGVTLAGATAVPLPRSIPWWPQLLFYGVCFLVAGLLQKIQQSVSSIFWGDYFGGSVGGFGGGGFGGFGGGGSGGGGASGSW